MQEIIDLCLGRAHLDQWVQQTGGAHDLFGNMAARVLQLIGSRRRRDMYDLLDKPLPLLKAQGTIVQRTWQTEAVLHQRLLARAIAVVHAPHLRDGHMAFVDENHPFFGEIVQERERTLTRRTAIHPTRVVLDARAHTRLLEHLEIMARALLDALRLQEHVALLEPADTLLHLLFNADHGALQAIRGRHIVVRRIDGRGRGLLQDLAAQRIHHHQRLDLITEHLDTNDRVVFIRRKDLDHITARTEGPAPKVCACARVLHARQSAQQVLTLHRLAAGQRQSHGLIVVRRTESIDARHRCHQQHIAALQQRARRTVAQAFDVLVARRVLLDEGVARRHIRLGLVVVVVADEVLDRVLGEEVFELCVQLRRQSLVGRQHQSRAVHLLDHGRHGEGLARTGDA